MPPRPNYGMDAPGWLGATAAAGVIALGVGVFFRILAPESGPETILRHAIWPAFVWLGYAAGHLWSSKVGKRVQARRMIDAIPWRGDERVLDVGCGHGLLLIEAAKRLSGGRAVGVDVWSSKDQWDNRPEATLTNARLEGVVERVEVGDADARALPFEDASFDVVLSSFVIHNIKSKDEQAQAVREMVRVLRPAGYVAILDIEGTRRYAHRLTDAGLDDVRRRPTWLFLPGAATVTGRKP